MIIYIQETININTVNGISSKAILAKTESVEYRKDEASADKIKIILDRWKFKMADCSDQKKFPTT